MKIRESESEKLVTIECLYLELVPIGFLEP
jgi:hypothetical protein